MLQALSGFCCAVAVMAAQGAAAQTVKLTEDISAAQITIAGQTLEIARNQDETATLTGDVAKTSRACPPFCIQRMEPVRGVQAVGELELIAFLENEVAAGAGVLIDARLPEWFAKGSIPGAVNLPFATLDAANPFRNDILMALGATPLGGSEFDFTNAVHLTLFCNGIWSDQALRGLQALRAAGYPADKLSYYRGGMQDWQILGLTIANPAIAGAQTAAAEGIQP
ncbi:MAG: rhodanese-like domain-containing protein [Paracoccaceae bacterium]